MQLRRWQEDAVCTALGKYRLGHSHFLCLATPGAGKTIMAANIAKRLIQSGDIDLIFCFSPSINVASSFRTTLESVIKTRLDGLLGSRGHVLTYQSMLNLDDHFWSLLITHRVFVIFDEIHHCSGDTINNANAWGQHIIQKVQGKATYTLALTGTPWRSDKIPIALSSYCHEGKVHCDYTYGLDQAIKDGVCRTPKIIAIDNDNILVKYGEIEDKYNSFEHLLNESELNYQRLLENTSLIFHIIELCTNKLNSIRKSHPQSGGLIVAASVEHALVVADILEKHTGEKAHIATYMHDDAQEIINRFRHSNEKWIISVGMISEGTDIPRLKVCCHLTRVKTELYFRQILGRILRAQNTKKEEAYLFMPAEPSLIEYAQRVAEDVPAPNTISLNLMKDLSFSDLHFDEEMVSHIDNDEDIVLNIEYDSKANPNGHLSQTPYAFPATSLSDSYETTLGLFGRFKTRMISLSLIGS